MYEIFSAITNELAIMMKKEYMCRNCYSEQVEEENEVAFKNFLLVTLIQSIQEADFTTNSSKSINRAAKRAISSQSSASSSPVKDSLPLGADAGSELDSPPFESDSDFY